MDHENPKKNWLGLFRAPRRVLYAFGVCLGGVAVGVVSPWLFNEISNRDPVLSAIYFDESGERFGTGPEMIGEIKRLRMWVTKISTEPKLSDEHRRGLGVLAIEGYRKAPAGFGVLEESLSASGQN